MDDDVLYAAMGFEELSFFRKDDKYKKMSLQAAANAEDLIDEQDYIDYGRAVLANIRQQRIAQAQLTVANQNPSFVSTGAIGAASNINSSFASEAGYSYSSTARQQRIEDFQKTAGKYLKKQAKKDAEKKMYTQLLLTAAGAGIGAVGAGAAAGGLTAAQGAVIGAQLGGGVGQIIQGNVSGGVQAGINAYGMAASFPTNTTANVVNKTYEQSPVIVKSYEQMQREQLLKSFNPNSILVY